jgi:hypothetical protein
MRTIYVRNASIFATVNRHKIDVEIRSTKDSAQGLALIVDNIVWLEVDIKQSIITDTKPWFHGKPLLQIDNVLPIKQNKRKAMVKVSKEVVEVTDYGETFRPRYWSPKGIGYDEKDLQWLDK